MLRSLVLLLVLVFASSNAMAQTLDVTFRFVPQPEDVFSRAFLPGEFNGWGPNSSGVIATGAASAMTFNPVTSEWMYTTSLSVGVDYQYKVHLHLNQSGSSYSWFPDPLNSRVVGNDNNSVFTVSDPMVFQLARKRNASGQIVAVSAGIFSSSEIDEITFEVNGIEQDGMPYFDAESGIFRYLLPEPVAAGSQFKITATDENENVVTDEVGFVPPIVVDAPLPDGIRDGINYDESTQSKVTLSLFAPGINYAHVIGDFNNWEVDPDYLMKRDSVSADSIRFWLELPPLTPGVEYAFQYVINGDDRVGDPYSAKVLDQRDSFIGSTYPNLKPYPTQTSGMVSVLQIPTSDFEWTATDYTRPKQGELIVYELLIRDFLAAHDYATLIDTLDYLDNLGVNAIELMPVSEFDDNESWGYNPAFHLALDKYYGTATDFKRFVDECHKRGIAVILDVVYNHVTEQSPLYRIWGSAAASPYLNTTATHPFSVFVDVNHEYSGTRYWLDRANEWWLKEYNVDGFRFDLSKGFTQKTSTNDGVFRLYDAGRVATLQRMADQIWEVDSTAYVILEHFAENAEEKVLAEYRVNEGRPGMMLWGNQNGAYAEATMGYNDNGNSDFSGGYFKNRSWSVPNLVTYMESHDEQWLMFKNIAYGACSNAPTGGGVCDTNPGDYNIRDFATAYDRQKLAGAFFFTVPGPKMVWQFGELGYGYGSDGRECLRHGDDLGECPAGTVGRTGNKPLSWHYRNDPLRFKIYQTWSELLRLRESLPVFRAAETSVTQNLSSGVKVIQLSHPFDADAVVIGNFGVAEATGTPGFFYTGSWYNFFTGDTLEVTDTQMSMTLAPGEFHVYTSERVEPPQAGLVTVGVDDMAVPAESSALLDVYPNPFATTATLRFVLERTDHVSVVLYDALGRHVRTIVDTEHAHGEHRIDIDASGIAAGLYFVQFQAGSDRKMLKVVHR